MIQFFFFFNSYKIEINWMRLLIRYKPISMHRRSVEENQLRSQRARLLDCINSSFDNNRWELRKQAGCLGNKCENLGGILTRLEPNAIFIGIFQFIK